MAESLNAGDSVAGLSIRIKPIRTVIVVDASPALALGIELHLTPTSEGGRSKPLLDLAARRWAFRPNWGLPSMTPPAQTGAPVLAFSRDTVLPGESVYAVIATPFPELVDQWRLEVEPGVELAMYEGARIYGHATVIWRTDITLPLGQHEEHRLMRWLANPAAPLSAS